jgi:shikimate kinase
MRIFLNGLPGAGKTYWGMKWAQEKGMDFYDLDTMIENEERMSVEKIFAIYGEGYFREKEAAVLRNTDRFENCIIACGGGTPCFFDNMDWMNRNGITVFLDESPENIFGHLLNDKTARPLLPEGVEALQTFIKEKSAERYGFYAQSKIRLEPREMSRQAFEEVLKRNKNA